ncbi:MAG: Ppx/GppA family phosphatase [Pseudomonadota bacterium]
MTVLRATDQIMANATPPLIGVIDVGSNSIRLVVFEDDARSPDYFFNEKTICKLGEGMAETGRLNPVGRKKAMAALRRFVVLARRMGVRDIIGLGTAAMRDAEDAPEFRDQVEEETGLRIRVASGQEEAKLSAEGVLLGWPNATGLIADLGGSSLEIAEARDGDIRRTVSTRAGHLRVGGADEADSRAALGELRAEAEQFAPIEGPLVLIGGAWRALAKAQMERTKYPMHVLMGYEMATDEALDLCDWALSADPQVLKRTSGSSTARLASIAAGAATLRTLLEALAPTSVSISAFGLREGLIYERMPTEMREEEPLISASRRMEMRSARSPGFGDELFNWLQPLISDYSVMGKRLSHAACLLHDVNWRQHPDFRSAACFSTVTRANLSGVGHKGRLYIGAALLHRYKASVMDRDVQAALKLLPADDLQSAEAVGRALRLGAMLTGSVQGLLGKSRLEISDTELSLILEPGVAMLSGERVERRVAALATAIGRKPRLVA